MTRIVPALTTGNHIGFLGQKVDQFSFTLVAPVIVNIIKVMKC